MVTGPTGSGKTTTLPAALATLNDLTRKILTIVDPPSALPSPMRCAQDPDAIMVGEMRDTETARVAIQASLTGHLVLTTLHTNAAAAAITRLIDLGLQPFLLSAESSLSGR